MRVVNNLTKPGDIRRVDLNQDNVRIQLSNGQDRVYRLTSELTVNCAWCGKNMGTKPGNGLSGITHGICPECEAKQYESMPAPDCPNG
jgi:hypothetical protein